MAAAMRVPVDADRLYFGNDPDYPKWVRAVVARTAEVQKEAHDQ